MCDLLEVIFQVEELHVEESHVASSILEQLETLFLHNLPKLIHMEEGSRKNNGL